jgi:hypothetical protein
VEATENKMVNPKQENSNENINTSGLLKVIPNPNNGVFTIILPQNCEFSNPSPEISNTAFVISNTERSRSIEITNIEGKNIDFQTISVESNNMQIKVPDAKIGIYLLKARCLDGSTFVSRILIK